MHLLTSCRHSLRGPPAPRRYGSAYLTSAAWEELVVVGDRGRRHIVGAAPQHELLVAELLPGPGLVLALQRAVVALVLAAGTRRTGSQSRPASSRACWRSGWRGSAPGVHTSGRRPDCASSLPPSAASCAPVADNPTSTHPVNRPFAFHSLSPWRSGTSVLMITVSLEEGTCCGLTGLLRACRKCAAPADGSPPGGSRPLACTLPRSTSRVPATRAGSTSTWSRWPSSWPAGTSRWRSSPARSVLTPPPRWSWCRACWSAT